ncbi:MAG: Autotransporter beta-domain-containing protein, partial [Verrucomicrobia bacterium]
AATGLSGDGYTEGLNAFVSGTAGFGSAGGSVALLAAGGTSASALTLGLGAASVASAGMRTGTVSITFQTDGTGTSGLAAAEVGTQSLNLSGTVYRVATGSLLSKAVRLGNIREGGAFTTAVIGLQNGAAADGFSDDLAAAISSASAGFITTGSVAALAAGSIAASTLNISYAGDTSAAGEVNGSAAVAFTSRGRSGTGLLDTTPLVGSGTIQITGSIYRLAVGSLTSGTHVNMGAIRLGSAFAPVPIGVSNAAITDGLSDDLAAVIGATTGGFVGTGSVASLAAGAAASRDLVINYGGTPLTAGSLQGTATVSYLSKGTAGSNLEDATPQVAAQTLSLIGAVYRAASVQLNGGSSGLSLELGRVHAGGSFTSGSLVVGNAAAMDGYSDDLAVDFSPAGDFVVSKHSLRLAAGSVSTVNVTFGGDTMAAGVKSATLVLALTSSALFGTALADMALPAETVNVSGQVYSGKGLWNAGTSGVWTDWNQWSAAGGRPGLDAALSRGVDTATLNSGTSSVVVALGGSTVELASLALEGSGGVRLTQGTVLLSALAGSALVAVSGGTHSIEAALHLSQHTEFNIAPLSKLSIDGLVTGFGSLTKLGGGTLYLAAGYAIEGPTSVTGGRLELGVGARLGVGDITLAQGTQLAFNLAADVILPNKIRGEGTVLNLNPLYNVTWDGGSTVVQIQQVPSGGAIDLSTLTPGKAVQVTTGSINLSQEAGVQVAANHVSIGTLFDLVVAKESSLELSGSLSGSGGIAKKSSGALILSGTNSYTGGTDILGGTLVTRATNALGEGEVKISAPALLLVDPVAASGTLTISNAITGEGKVLIGGSGRVLLAGSSNNYTGGTEVAGGTLEVRKSGALAAGPVAIKTFGTLLASVAENERMTLPNNFSGEGALIKEQPGTLVLSGSNTLARGLVLNAGTLEVAPSGSVGAGLRLNGGVLSFTSSPSAQTPTGGPSFGIAAPVLVAGTVAVNVAGGASVELAGDFSGSGTVTKQGAGILKISGKIDVAMGSSLTIDGAQGGSTGVAKSGAGTLVWSGVGLIQGGLIVSGGALEVKGQQVLSESMKTGGGTLSVSEDARFVGNAIFQEGSTIVSSVEAFTKVPLLVVGGKNSEGVTLDVSAVEGGLALNMGQTLKGRGVLRGSIAFGTGSILAPGNSIDTETIEGSASFKGGVYEAEYALHGGNFSSDLLRVIANSKTPTGASNIGVATLTNAVLAPIATTRVADFLPHTSVILTADKIFGDFQAIESSAVIKTSVSKVLVDRNDNIAEPSAVDIIPLREGVAMTVQRLPYSQVVTPGVRSQIGAALDRVLTSAYIVGTSPLIGGGSVSASTLIGDGSLAAVLNILDGGSQAKVNALIDQLSPQVYAELYSQSLSRLHDIQNTVSDRLSALGTALVTAQVAEVLAQSTSVSSEDALSAWTNTYGSASSHPANYSIGDGGASLSNYGNVTGVERRRGSLTLGLMGAVGSGSEQMNLTGAHISTDAWHLGIYMSSPLAWRLFLDVSGFYGEGDNTIRRTQNIPGLGVVQSRVKALTQEWLLQVGMGAQLAPTASRWSIVPSVRVAYAGMKQSGILEDGAGSLGVRTDAAVQGTFMTRTGLEVATEWRLGRLPVRTSGGAAWVHDFDAGPRSVGVRWQGASDVPWAISSGKQTSDTLRAGLSFELGLGDRRTLRLYGEQEFLQGNRVLRGGVNYSIGF